MRRALAGARTLFLVSGFGSVDRLVQHLTAVHAASKAGWRDSGTRRGRTRGMATGEMDIVTDPVERLAGHPPQSMEPFLRAHRDLWSHLIASTVS